MLRFLCAILLVCGSLLSGCFSMPIIPGTGWHIDSPEESWVMFADDSIFDDPEEMPVMSSPEGTRALLLRAPRGSKVVLTDEANNRFSGTLLRADEQTVELMNCLSKEIIPGPKGLMQCKTSHVGFQSLSTPSLVHLRYIAPPPPDFDAQAFTEDPCEHCVDAIIYASGRRERFSSPPEPLEPAAGTADLDEE